MIGVNGRKAFDSVDHNYMQGVLEAYSTILEKGMFNPLQWFSHRELWFYPLVSLLGGDTRIRCIYLC